MEKSAILLRRLNPYCARAMEGAAALCQTRAHAEIFPEHWLLEQGEGDLSVLARRYEWDMDSIWQDLLGWLDKQPRSVRHRPQLSDNIRMLMQDAWLLASLAGEQSIRSIHLLMVLVEKQNLIRCDGLWPLLTPGHSQFPRCGSRNYFFRTHRVPPDSTCHLLTGNSVMDRRLSHGANIMSLTDTFNNTLSALTEGGLNRYRLDIPSCTASLDVEEFSGREFMSELYHYTILFTSSDQHISSSQLLAKPATLTMGSGPLAGLRIFYFFTLQPDPQTEMVHFADKQSARMFGKSLPLSSPSSVKVEFGKVKNDGEAE